MTETETRLNGLDMSIRHYGALGIIEREVEFPAITDDEAASTVRDELASMTPMDRVEVVLYRRHDPLRREPSS